MTDDRGTPRPYAVDPERVASWAKWEAAMAAFPEARQGRDQPEHAVEHALTSDGVIATRESTIVRMRLRD